MNTMGDSVRVEDLTLTIISLRRVAELDSTLGSVGSFPNVQVILNGAKLQDYEWIVQKYRGRVTFHINPKNIGVGAAFNQGIVTAPTRYVVLSGDDLQYSPGWADALVAWLNDNDPRLQVSLSEPVRFSSFCVDKALIAIQGWFDHNYTRIYYEDEDWELRTRERLGLYNDTTPSEEVIPRLGVVHRPHHESAPWNSIPNRLYFWRKWQRVSSGDDRSLRLTPTIMVKRRVDEPSWAHLELVRASYRAGDYKAQPFVYDCPSRSLRLLTWATTNALFIGVRKLYQRHFNPREEIK